MIRYKSLNKALLIRKQESTADASEKGLAPDTVILQNENDAATLELPHRNCLI